MNDPDALTAQHIKALRNADWVRFYWDGQTTTADAHKRATRDGFPTEVEVEIPVVSARLTVYENNGSSGRTEANCAIGVISSARVDELWQSVAHILRTGDRLRPHFVANNNGGTLRTAGLTHDEFRIMVLRGYGEKQRTLEFLLDTQVSTPDSPVRIVRVS